MTDKPTYDNLQQRVKELEKENQEHKKKYEELLTLEPEVSLINELKKSERRVLETSALLECSQAIIIHREFEQTARCIFDSAKDLIGATSGYVALLSEDGMENEVLFLDDGGLSCTVDPNLPMPIRGLREKAYRTRKAVFENSFSNSKWMAFMPIGHVILDNVLFAPLKIEGKARGLIGLANKPGDFTENDARIITAFSEFAAIALGAWYHLS
ncbi:MAG: GAF domain-containing protein [Deltaproteobacteria bacterium]|nr:GAF domain-containing protein [Deltaproteobacteria bacterium]